MLVNECRKGCDCIRQKYRVVQKIFMALIAKNRSLAFMTPWARRKDTISDCAATVGRAAEEALSNKVMLRGVTPTLSGGSRIGSCNSMQDADRKSTRLNSSP